MSVGIPVVKKMVHSARIKIEESELAKYESHLSQVLDWVAKIQKLDTSSVAPMGHPLHEKQRLRDDVVTATNQRESNQSMAPQVEAGLYLVPQVIE